MFKWIVIISIAFISYLNADIKVLAIAGSTREQSVNKKLLNSVAHIMHSLPSVQVACIDLKNFPMPFYDADFEKKFGLPPYAKKLQELMCESDLIIIASPEYNGSVSAILKNAIDWTSRSENNSMARKAYKEKHFVLICATPGSKGTQGLQHLRDILQNIGGIVFPKQFVINKAYHAFDEHNRLKDAAKEAQLKEFIVEILLNLNPSKGNLSE